MSFVVARNQGTTTVVTLNRPERLNAIGRALVAELHEALSLAQADTSTQVIVLTGAGRAFCAGDDLKEFDEQAADSTSIEAHVSAIQQITRDLMFGDKLVIGAVHGYAVGGGFEWTLNCDLVVAGEDLVAFFPEMRLGHFVTGGVTHLLPMAVGYHRAIELMVLGERYDARALLSLGLVNRVVPCGSHVSVAMELAAKVASCSAMATTNLKRVLNKGLNGQLDRALDLEAEMAAAGFESPDTRRRVVEFSKAHF